MLLQKMKLENFQGIKSLEIDFRGRNAYIYADNAIGKTTIYNAYTWLLFDKPSTGAKNWTPKTYTEDGEAHYLMHSAEAEFTNITIKKVYREVYTRKRGTQEDEFSGHTTDYYVNNMPVSQLQYNDALQEHFGTPEQTQLITVLNYFPETLHWTNRRRLLIDICGDVSDSDVIASDKKLEKLSSSLVNYKGIDELKKASQIKKSEANRLLQEIPTRIDETEQNIPNTSGFSEEKLTAERETLNDKTKELITKKAEISNINTAQITDAIRSKELEIKQLKTNWSERKATLTADLYKQINELNSKAGDLNAKKSELSLKIEDTKNKIQWEEKRIEHINLQIDDNKQNYDVLYASKWDEKQGICPTCSQALPKDKISSLMDEFFKNKSEKLNTFIDKENELKTRKVEILNILVALKEKRDAAEKDIGEVNKEIETLSADKKREELNAQIEKINGEVSPVENDPGYIGLTEEIDKLNIKLQNVKSQSEQQLSELDIQIRELEKSIEEVNKTLSLFDSARRGRQRMEELRVRLVEVQEQYKEQDAIISLCEDFMKTKMTMLNDRINSRFKNVKFRLFQYQINGGIAEDCEVMIPSPSGDMVPFAHANHGARINAGLEIISVLSDAWNLSLPLFIDNAESITKINLPTVQTIQLIVSEPDKTLRFEFV